MLNTFEKTCKWLENIEGYKTPKELQNHIKSTAGDECTCSSKWLKQKLIETY